MTAHEFRFSFDEDFLRRALRRDVYWLGVYGALGSWGSGCAPESALATVDLASFDRRITLLAELLAANAEAQK